MRTHTRWLLPLLLLVLCATAGAADDPPGAQGSAGPEPTVDTPAVKPAPSIRVAVLPPAEGKPAGPLDRLVDLAVEDADLAAIARGLSATGVVTARIAGKPAARRVALTTKATPLRDVLDGAAGLFGLRWEQRGTTVIFVERRPPVIAQGPTPGGSMVAAAPVATATAPIAEGEPNGLPSLLPPMGQGAQNPAYLPARLQEAVETLRRLGVGAGPRPDFVDSTPSHHATVQQLAEAFPEEQREAMRRAGTRASELGVPVRYLPQGARRQILNWQGEQYAIQTRYFLWNAAQHFDPDRILDAVLYLSYTQDADGLPRQRPALVLKGKDWSNSFGIVPVLDPEATRELEERQRALSRGLIPRR